MADTTTTKVPRKRAAKVVPKADRRNGRMTEEHREALVAGRNEGRIVRHYLDVLEQNKPRRGRRRSPEAIQNRIEVIEEKLTEATGFDRVMLIQERIDLWAALQMADFTTDISLMEDEFVNVAKDFSERKGITYAAWREAGVSADVLKRAGIGRSTI